MDNTIHPFTLIILDGWGVSMPHRGNAISMAVTPFFDEMISRYYSLTLQASGEAVGLPWGEMGNSEVGHLTIGSGRVLYQNLPRITRSISDGSFFSNPAFLKIADHVKKHKSKLHIMGLVSNGGIHSSNEHLYALLELCKMHGIKNVFLHAFLDGRDTPHNSGQKYIIELESRMQNIGVGHLATLSGRFYAMDRDNRWNRVEKAYLAIAEGKSDQFYESSAEAIQASYDKNVFDEEFVPVVLRQKDYPYSMVQNGDGIIFFNFRPDRCREITKAFILPGFERFHIPRKIDDLFFVSMTEYEKDLPVSAIAYPPESITSPLARVISDSGLKQIHIAETEKYPHVTFFFNGGREDPFPGEDRILIPSPRVDSYDMTPAMSAKEITQKTTGALIENKHHFYVINFANADMVGHTGNLRATIKAVEILDSCLKIIIQTVLDFGGVACICADHGNAEEKIKPRSGLINKEHSTNPIPFIIIGKDFENDIWKKYSIVRKEDLSIRTPSGVLSDIAPTVLKILRLSAPKEMTGRPLV